MTQIGTRRCWGTAHEVLAALATAMLVVAPAPVMAQNGSSEGETEKASTEEGDSDSGGEESGGPVPDLYLLSTESAEESISDIVPERIGDLLRKRVAGNGGVDLVKTLRERRTAGADKSVTAAIEEARKKYTSGLGLVNAEKYEEAAKELQSAVDTLKENIADLREFDVLADALLNLARAYWETGSNYDARRRIRQFAHLRPDAELDPEKYAADLRKLYDREVEKIEKAGTGKLEVSADVEGAKIFVDGEQKGTTPATITDVGFGHHYMVVRHPTKGAWSQKLRVRARGKKQSYEVSLEDSSQEAKSDEEKEVDLPSFYTELKATIREGTFGTNLEPYLEELIGQTEVEYVAWVVMIKGEEAYVAAPFVYRASDGKFIQGDNVEFNFDLSNLMSGVSSLRDAIITGVEEMSDEKEITKVSLVDEEEKEKSKEKKMASAEGTQRESSSTSGGSSESGTASSSKSGGESVDPPPTTEESPPSESSGGGNNALTYGLLAGGAVLVGAGVVGGAYYFGDAGAQKPSGFTANISW